MLLSLALVAAAAAASDYEGTVRAGFVATDYEGFRGVDHPSMNVYEGALLSLEGFSYRMDNGMRVTADLKSIAMNNRNLTLGIAKSGRGSLTLSHNKYQRIYGEDSGTRTRRQVTNGRFWWQLHKSVRVFGGLGQTEKRGMYVPLFVIDTVLAIGEVDYSHLLYHGGVTFRDGRRLAQVEYYGSDFGDDVSSLNDRKSSRIRATASAPLPNYENIVLNAGFQHYVNRIENRDDTLRANTVWGGARFFYGDGYVLRYSFIFDRARRTGDLSATDNIANALYVGKTWKGQGGLMLGYRYTLQDDVVDEITGNGYYVSGWARPVAKLMLKAGYGSEKSEVQAGRTLTGDADYTREWGSVKYETPYGPVRVKVENKNRDNDDIGSEVDFIRVATDMSMRLDRYGEMRGSYAYHTGEYENSAGTFEYNGHVLSGDLMTESYRGAQGGLSGTYYRAKQDVDVESFRVGLTARYTFESGLGMQAIYTAYNFDNLADSSPVYTEYLTTNVVEFSLSYEL